MKTILFTFVYPFHPERGGIERGGDLLAKSLLKRGYNILYLCLKCPTEYKGYNYPAPLHLFPNEIENSPENLQFYDTFLREHKIDIVINNSFFNDRPQYLSTGSNGHVKRISIIHSRPSRYYDVLYRRRDSSIAEWFKCAARFCLWQLKGGKKRCWREFAKTMSYISENSDRVCLLSDNFKEEYLRLAPNTPLHKLVAIPNPNSYPRQEQQATKRKQLLFVGRLEYISKRPDRLMAIWRKIYMQHPDWELVFVGNGEELATLKKMANKLERVRFVGYQNPKSYYEEASIFCMTSQFEGFPMVLAEAIIHGVVPVAFHSFASVTDIIEDERTGLLVTPFSLDEYAKKLSSLMGDESRRNEMAQQAVKSVERYDVEKIADRWEELFSTL